VKGSHTVAPDACVLIPMPLADTLLRLAAGPRLYVPRWSDQIMKEVCRFTFAVQGFFRRKVEVLLKS
jgi:hypothetical protein